MSVIREHSNLLQGDSVVPVKTVHNNVVTTVYGNLTFMGPCIVNVFFKNNQKDPALYSFNFTVNDLHVSGETAWNM